MKKIKIYYVAADRGALGYWRCILPAFHLNRSGLADTAVDFNIFQKEFVDWTDVVVIQRIVGSMIKKLIEYCRMVGKRVVYEIDDDVFNMPDSPEYPKGEERNNLVTQSKAVIEMCDAVTVSTETIGKSVQKETGVPCFLLPNCLDFSAWQRFNIQHQQLMVGWAGGHYHVQDLEMIVPSLEKLLDDNKDLVLVFMGACPLSLITKRPGRVFLQEFVPMELFPKTMAAMRFDIGLAPLYPTKFSRARSSLRLLQYSALEIPSVVSYWGEYANMIDNGFPCLVVKDNGDWKDKIQELIDDRDERTKVGVAAHKYVFERFDIKRNIHHWADVYNEISAH